MSFYPERINARFRSPKNAGKLKQADAVGTGVNFSCGVSVHFYLQIEPETKTITSAKFKTNGCGYVVAAADLLAESITGEKLTGLHGLERLENVLVEEFGEITPERQHCFSLCFDALHDALGEYRTAQIAECSGEKALICTCFGIAEETIERVIEEKNLVTVEAVGDKCNAGTGCGSCQPLIQEILDSVL